MAKVFGFSEEGFRKVQQATRRVLGSPRTGAQRRRQSPVVSPPNIRLGKTDESISSDSTGTVSIYSGDVGSETDTGDNIEGYSRGTDIDADIWVNIMARGGGYEIFPLECSS